MKQESEIKEPKRTTKLILFASKMILDAGFVPLPQGTTHLPDELAALQEVPGPMTGS
jgi:hypothetical protein